MSTKTVSLNEANDRDLFRFATEVLGLTVHPMTGREKLLAKIKAAHDKDTITVTDDTSAAGPAPQAHARTARPEVAGTEPMVTVIIDAQDEPGGKDQVFVSVNGVAMTIARGVESPIKLRYFEALRNAQKTIYEQVGEGKDAEMVARAVPMYPTRVIAMPSQAEIEAWYRSQNVQAAA